MQKRIVRNPDTKDFDMFIGTEYVGSRASRDEAEVELDHIYSTLLAHGGNINAL